MSDTATHVLTLMAFEPIADLGAAVAADLAITDAAVFLSDDMSALDLFLNAASQDVANQVAGKIGNAAIDMAIQPLANRRKKLLIADMDSTMIGQECIDELAAEVGLKDRVAAITAAAMRGEISFEPALRERVGLLKGLAESVIDEVIAKRITLTPGGPELVTTMRANGAYAALVSGGFTAFTSKIAARLGFDENRANTLLAADGVLTGEVGEPILGREAKIEALEEISARLGTSVEQAIAVGDGANDLGMIKRAGLGVALHAKPAVAAEADVKILHGDLSALLYLQGYHRRDWVTG